MTLTIEIEPATQRALEGKAARLGVPVERYAAGVLRRDTQNNDAKRTATKQGAAFLSLLEKARPIIAAGTLRTVTSGDITRAIDAARDRELFDV